MISARTHTMTVTTDRDLAAKLELPFCSNCGKYHTAEGAPAPAAPTQRPKPKYAYQPERNTNKAILDQIESTKNDIRDLRKGTYWKLSG
jgi:hypothetical protein